MQEQQRRRGPRHFLTQVPTSNLYNSHDILSIEPVSWTRPARLSSCARLPKVNGLGISHILHTQVEMPRLPTYLPTYRCNADISAAGHLVVPTVRNRGITLKADCATADKNRKMWSIYFLNPTPTLVAFIWVANTNAQEP